MLEKILEKKIGELGMVLSRPLPEEDFRIGVEIDNVGNPPYKSAIEMVVDMMKGKPLIPTFLQERVENESVPKIIRVSDINRGFGFEYGVSYRENKVQEYLHLCFVQSYLGRNRFDVNFYRDSAANVLFVISFDTDSKVQLQYMLEPSTLDFKIMFRSKSLREYMVWGAGLRQQIESGASPEQVTDYIFSFLKKRGLGTNASKIQNH